MTHETYLPLLALLCCLGCGGDREAAPPSGSSASAPPVAPAAQAPASGRAQAKTPAGTEAPGRASAPARAEVASAAQAPAQPAPRRGLWVLAEGAHRTLEAPERVDALLERSTAMAVTDLFVQVYRGGRSWFPSTVADPTPYREIRRKTGRDLFGELIARAHERGIRVHAWFNTLSLADNREAPILEAVGRDAVLVDRTGRSLLDYPGGEVPEPDLRHVQMGTPGIWLDPATPGVIEHLEAALGDLLAAHPSIDGVHLDFIRHPMALPLVPGSRFERGLDFGYGAPAKRAFTRATGKPWKRGGDWDAFRRDRVTELVTRLRAKLPEGCLLSAATIAYADRAYLTAMQDWRGWLRDGTLDFAVAMAYTTDDRLLEYLAGSLVGGVGGEHTWLGLGSWLFARTPKRIGEQLAIAGRAHPAGIVLFSYDALADRPETIPAVPWSAP